MDVRLHFSTGSAGNAFAHLPRGLVGEWGMDYQTEGYATGNTVSAAANGGRGR